MGVWISVGLLSTIFYICILNLNKRVDCILSSQRMIDSDVRNQEKVIDCLRSELHAMYALDRHYIDNGDK